MNKQQRKLWINATVMLALGVVFVASGAAIWIAVIAFVVAGLGYLTGFLVARKDDQLHR